MPQIFKIGPYTIYFWSNENDPLEPIHVHVSERANPNATKIWLTSTGKCYLCHNKSGFSAISCESLRPAPRTSKPAGWTTLGASAISAERINTP